MLIKLWFFACVALPFPKSRLVCCLGANSVDVNARDAVLRGDGDAGRGADSN